VRLAAEELDASGTISTFLLCDEEAERLFHCSASTVASMDQDYVYHVLSRLWSHGVTMHMVTLSCGSNIIKRVIHCDLQADVRPWLGLIEKDVIRCTVLSPEKRELEQQDAELMNLSNLDLSNWSLHEEGAAADEPEEGERSIIVRQLSKMPMDEVLHWTPRPSVPSVPSHSLYASPAGFAPIAFSLSP
jgi:hypothetical protein